MAAAPEGLSPDTGETTQVSVAEMMAELQLLGHGKPAEDEESQDFARKVRRLNPGWQPGEIPRVPRGYRSGAEWRQASRDAKAARKPRRAPRPRGSARTGRPKRRTSGRLAQARAPGEDGPEPSGRVCEGCGQSFSNRRGRFCAACNQARYRARKREAAVGAEILERARLARAAIRAGADPYACLALVVWPPETADEARAMLRVAA